MKVATWKSIAALCCLMAIVVAPAPVWAQQDGSIAGNVTDETGGALPGVTATASSDALIEQSRTSVTDGSGNYQIIRLPPGEYTVTFALAGFNTVIQEGIVLSGSFTAPADAVLPIGELSESVTVTSTAPLVDIVSTRQQSTLTAERVNVLPGAAGIMTAADYVPGATTSGGVQGHLASVHGGDPHDSQPAIDGIRTGTQLQGRNAWSAGVGGAVTNEAIVTEVVFDTSAQNAEYAQSGVRTNVIPKAGGNNFSFDYFMQATNQRFATNNLSAELEDQGFRFAPTKYSWSINPAAGGPIKENYLWFFGSMYERRSESFILDRFFDLNEPSTPDGVTEDDLRVFNPSFGAQQTIRITHQASQRHKLTYNYMRQTAGSDRNIVANFGEVGAEAAYWFTGNPTYLTNARWTAPLTNRLLIEADVAYQRADVHTGPQDHGGELRTQITNQGTGAVYGSSFQNHHNQDHHRRANVALSYVTGSHNFKTGLNYANNFTRLNYTAPGEIFGAYEFNGSPLGVLVSGNSANAQVVNMNCDCGIYAQDAWTMDRLTINGGVRFDWFNGSVPGGTREAGFFAPEVTTADPIVENTPNWKDTTVRFGVAYDLLGDGSTAVKFSAGKYVSNEGTGVTSAFNPINAYSLDWRSWSDVNGDGTPLGTDGIPQFDEIGPSFNPNFGTGVVTTQYDTNTPRGTNWELAGGIERQLGPGWALTGMLHYRKYGDFRWTRNLNQMASDYHLAGQWTGPVDSELPGSSSGRVFDVYNANPGFEVVTGNARMTGAPENWSSWKGFEVIVDGELPRGGFMTASLTAGKSRDHFCQVGVSQNPNSLVNCDTTSPYRPMAKLSGALPLPYDTMISGLFQVLPGSTIDATYVMNSTDFPALNLGGQSVDPSLTFNLITPNTEFDPYRTQLNIRFSKVITIGDVRTRVYMDATNLFNQTRVTRRNQTYGGGETKNASFLRILGVERGRLLSFGLQASF